VKHLDEGELRRLIDEPGGFDDEVRRHAAACDVCRARRAALEADARLAARLLAGAPVVDAQRAYALVQERIAARTVRPAWYRPLAACAAAAAFVLALIFTPLGGYARSFLTIFEPQQFQPIDVTRDDLRDLRLLPQANDVGTQRVLRKPVRTVYGSIASAQQHSAFALLKPAVLPAHFGSVHQYSLMAPGEMTFTFSAKKARAFVRQSGKSLPPMPAGLDGATIHLQTGNVFTAHYEAATQMPKTKRRGPIASFELIEAQRPRVTSSGTSLQTLEQYLLAMPNVSPQLAQQIRALGDIRNTLPVPVAIDKQSAQSITVQGVKGLAIGDNTGLGAGVMWQKNGIVYIVTGPLSMNEVMTVANGLR
jgi:hypothetical protein